MAEFLVPAMAAIITAGAASVTTFLAVRRAKSGQIRTTEADVLWDEAGSIRRELREQVQQLQDHIDRNDVEIASLRTENATLKHEVLTLRTENASLKVQIEDLRAENVELRQKQQRGTA